MAVPGTVSLSYRICELASPANCATATATITIPAPPIVATADSFTLGIGSSGDVLANDTLGGAPATAANVGVTPTTTLPAGVTLSAAGLLQVGASATSGTYDIGYRICQTAAPSNCATATANLIVPAIGTVSGLVTALSQMRNQFGGGQVLQQFDTANRLLNAIHGLGDSIGLNVADAVKVFSQSIDPVLNALNASPVCDADPACVTSRDQLRQAAEARNNGTLDRIAELGRQLQAVQSSQTLGATTDTIGAALNSVNQSLKAAGIDSPANLEAQLSQLQTGVDTLADGSRKVADGVQLLVDQTKKLGVGLDEASLFLLGMKTGADTPATAGFYVPSQILTGDEFRRAAGIFISPDGHTARYLVQTKLNPFSAEAMDQVNAIIATAKAAQPNTTLADASISMTGFSVTLRDVRDYYYRDLRLIVLTTILVVTSILIILLRALVAPLYLILSVILSYLSALGIGVLFFQFGLHQQLHWSIPGLTFIILVAVGADYNLLLISRIRDESPSGIRSGVIRTVSQTGGVITAAGLIFAASMLGLQFSTITTLVQMGFIIGMGILLDTFLVRTVTVPATAVLVGKANWWPSKWQPAPRPRRGPELPEAEALSAVAPG